MLLLFTLVNATCMATGIHGINANLHYSASSALSTIKSDVLGAKSMLVLGGHILRINTGSEIVSYYIQNNQLYRQEGTNKLPITENAASVTFRCLKPGLVEVVYEAGASGRSYRVQSAYNIRSMN